MITMKKNLLLIMVFAGCFSSINLCGQSAQPEYDLQFEVSEQSVRWATGPTIPPRQRLIRPKYMVVLHLKRSSIHLRDDYGFRKSLEGIVSPEQSRFMSIQPPGKRSGHFISYGGLSDKGYEIGLYGVSEKDVRIMAKSLIKWVNEKVEAELESTKSSLEKNRKQKSEIEKLIDKQRKEIKEIEEKLSELKKSVPYQSIEDAHKSLVEFNKVLQLIEVEIVGIEAKLRMIKKQYEILENQSSNYPKSTSDLLFQMRLTQEIELAGALARKNAAQLVHKKALDFCNLTEQAEILPQKLGLNQEQLKKNQSIISRWEKDLANPPDRMMPIELADSKVVIYPIEDE